MTQAERVRVLEALIRQGLGDGERDHEALEVLADMFEELGHSTAAAGVRYYLRPKRSRGGVDERVLELTLRRVLEIEREIFRGRRWLLVEYNVWSEREKPVRAYSAQRSALLAVARLENSISVAIREGRLHEPSVTYYVRYADR